MSKKETWKPVEFKGKKPKTRYVVSSEGRFGVKHDNGKVEVRNFKPQKGGHRYNYKVNGESRSLFVHREVAKAFVRKPSPKHNLIIRKDHDYNNPHPSNLQWVTKDEHRKHVTDSPKSILSRKKRAITESPTARIFDEKSAREVKRLIWDPKRKLTYKQIAKKYGVSEMQIYRMKNGELWYHIHVENEPIHARYKENQANIEWHEKQQKKNKVSGVSKKTSGASKKDKKKQKKEARQLKKELKKQKRKDKKSAKKKKR